VRKIIIISILLLLVGVGCVSDDGRRKSHSGYSKYISKNDVVVLWNSRTKDKILIDSQEGVKIVKNWLMKEKTPIPWNRLGAVMHHEIIVFRRKDTKEKTDYEIAYLCDQALSLKIKIPYERISIIGTGGNETVIKKSEVDNLFSLFKKHGREIKKEK